MNSETGIPEYWLRFVTGGNPMLKRAILGTILIFWVLNSSMVHAVCADFNGDAIFDVADLSFGVFYLFSDGAPSPDFDQADNDEYE